MKREKYVHVYKRKKTKENVFYVKIPPHITSNDPTFFAVEKPSLHEANAYSLDAQASYARHKSNSRKQVKLRDSSVAGLVRYYIGTEDYYNLSDNSKLSYDRLLDNALDLILPGYRMRLGDMSGARVDRDHVKEIITLVREQYSHHRALHTIKALRIVWNVAVRNNKLKDNPFSKPRIKHVPDREVIWTHEQVMSFINEADEMGLHSVGSLAYMCYQLCQRPGDMRQLTWEQVHSEGRIVFNQEKTGTRVFLRLSPDLMERLRKYHNNESGPILICEINNKPFYDRYYYAKLCRRVKKRCNLPSELSIGDLRRTGTTRLATSGCTEDEIMSVTGHRNREQVSTYVQRSQDTSDNAFGKAWSMR
jgi:integrase